MSLSRPELARYARHLVLPEVGREGQERLAGSRVLLVGAGGLGSPVGLYLAAAGVGTLGIIDDDHVDLTNLQRQVLHGSSDVGRLKVDSARDRIAEVNPHTQVETYPGRLTSSNALELFSSYDVVVDGSDNFPTRYLVNDACVLTGTPNVFGSVYRWEGQLSLFAAPGGPCYRCLFREPPPPGLIPNCAEAGVFGALPGVIGSAQAMETVKHLLGVGKPLAGRFLVFDAMAFTWRELEIRRNLSCPVCGDAPTQTDLIDYHHFCGLTPEDGASGATIPGVIGTEIHPFMDRDPSPFLIDVREPFEWDADNLEDLGAVLIPRGDLEGRIPEIPRDRPVLVYCQTGARSLAAARLLKDAGVHQVHNLVGGLTALRVLP